MKKRKLNKKQWQMILPIVFLLFAGLIFWIMKGNVNDAGRFNNVKKQNAFNSKLPDANLQETGKNKLEIYMEAQKDSARLKEELQRDPYEKRFFDPGPPTATAYSETKLSLSKRGIPIKSEIPVDQNEKKVNDRLEKLYAALESAEKQNPDESKPITPLQNEPNKSETEKLEQLMQSVQKNDTTGDPEMKQIENMLDKILDIQHPQRVSDRLSANQNSENKHLLNVRNRIMEADNTGIDADDPITRGFFGFQANDEVEFAHPTNTIMATIHENKTVAEGGSVKLRLLQDIYIGNTVIPKDNFMYGICKMANERVDIFVTSIVYLQNVFPVQLQAYDIDGLEGVYVPGTMNGDVGKDGLNQAIQQMQLTALDPSVGAQAANAGIQTAKTLLSKKTKAVVAHLKANHILLFKSINSN